MLYFVPAGKWSFIKNKILETAPWFLKKKILFYLAGFAGMLAAHRKGTNTERDKYRQGGKFRGIYS